MKKHTKKTLFSLFLTLVLIIGLMPSLAAYTFADEEDGSAVTGSETVIAVEEGSVQAPDEDVPAAEEADPAAEDAVTETGSSATGEAATAPDTEETTVTESEAVTPEVVAKAAEEEASAAPAAGDTDTDADVPEDASYDDDVVVKAAEEVAKNTDTDETYPSLQAAVDAATAGDTLTLLADSWEKVTVSKDIVLDLGIYMLYSDGVTLSIKDGATVTLTDGTIRSEGNPAAVSTEGSGTAFIMTGGRVENTTETSLGAIRLSGTGDSLITGGDVSTIGGSGSAVSVSNGTLTVSGGTIYANEVGTGSGAALTAGFTSNNDTGTITVNDGTIMAFGDGPSVSIGTPGSTFNINGGIFGDDKGNGTQFTRPAGMVLVPLYFGFTAFRLGYPEGTVTVNENTGTAYTGLADAVASASAGDTIKMVADETLSDTVTSNKTITLDLNGKTISGTAERLIYVSDGTLTIDDSAGGGMIHNTATSGWRDAVDVGYVTGPHPAMVLKGGTLKSDKGQAIENAGTLDIEGGKIISADYTGLYNNNGTITISGDAYVEGRPNAIDTNAGWPGKIYIKGGKFVSKAGGLAGAICVRSGKVEISGGEIEGPYGVDVTHANEPSKGTVTFTEDSTSVVTATKYDTFKRNGGTVNINGGYFSDDLGNDDDYNRPEDGWLQEVTEGEHAGYWQLMVLDKTALQEAVDEAIDPADIEESEDGAKVPVGKKWATADDKAAYEKALKAAEDVLENARTQQEIDDALTDLQAAEEKIKDGTYEEVTLTYDLNGGTLDGKTGTVEVKIEKGETIILPEPTRDGYDFDYWEGSKYYAGDEYEANEDHTLTAQWIEQEEPEDPEDPEGPTDDPEEPTDDSEEPMDDPDEPTDEPEEEPEDAPATGDEAMLGLAMLALIGSGAVIAGLRRKETK